MKKNGFVFAETIIVCAVLCASLIAIYTTFSLIVQNQKERLRHNQSAEIHSLYLIRDYILDLYGPAESMPANHNIGIFKCTKNNSTDAYIKAMYLYNNVLDTKPANYNLCVEIYNTLNLQNAYIIQNKNGKDIVKNLNNKESSILKATFISYLKTVSKIENNGDFIIIGEFYRNKEYYYASLILPRGGNL